MAVEIEDNDENLKVFHSATAVTSENGQYVIHGPNNTIQAVYPKEEVRKIEVKVDAEAE